MKIQYLNFNFYCTVKMCGYFFMPIDAKKQFLVQHLLIGLTVKIVKVKIEITTISFNFKKTFKLHLPQKHFRSKKQHYDLSFCQFFLNPLLKIPQITLTHCTF